jgi:biofilm PGA synthesis protein PgaA
MGKILRLLLTGLALCGGAARAADLPEPDDARYRQAIVDARAGRHEQALGALGPLVERHPARQDLLGDYAVVLGWAERHAAALALLPRIDLANAPAHVLEGLANSARRDPYATLAANQSILSRDPRNRAALRGKIFALAALGTPQLALELAERNPGVVTDAERDSLAADRTAHRIRWGQIAADTGRGPARFDGIDRALADSEAAGARALDPAAGLTAAERQLALDRIGALQVRYRMREAVALHAALAARPPPLPAYAQASAAGAWLYLEQPEKARDLYRAALAGDPDNLEWRIGLFYALAESEAHGEALDEIERAVALTPQSIDQWSRQTVRENPAYARVLAARAMAPLYANRPGEAWERLRDLAGQAPYNMEIRTDLASAMRARGWPRAAEEELRWILAADPDNSGALGERAGALLEMREYREAAAALALAQSVSAEDGRVVRAARFARVHGLRELVVDGTVGRSSGDGPAGARDHAVEARLYSSPLAENYRAFAHLFTAQARYAAGAAERSRGGIGLEYRSPLLVASGELSHAGSGLGAGASVALAFTPGDHWTLHGEADSSANETPLQATLAGVDARRVAGGVRWRAHESRRAALSHARMDFSDGNRRDTTQASWTERVVAGPVYRLELTGALYASANSLAGAPYFNPSRDFSPTVEFANEWLQWRRYASAFRHRLVLALGSYWQQGFGSGALAGARYEQEWQADERLTLRYGIGRSLHPYDGVRTTHDYAYFSLNWRF